MNGSMRHGLAVLTVFAFCSGSAFGQTVELQANDNSSRVTGELISYNGKRYMMRTTIGVVPFDAEEYTCIGTYCPVIVGDKEKLSVAGPAELADVVFPLLAEGYAEQQELYADVVGEDGLPIADRRAFTGSDPASGKYGSFDVQFSDEEDETAGNILVQEASGERLFNLLTSKEAEIVISEASISDASRAAGIANRIGDLTSFEQERIVAVDGFTAVVNRKNKLGKLTLPQISAIMSGKIENWRELGGEDKRINVYSFAKDTEAFNHIRDLVLTPFQAEFTENAEIVASGRQLSRAIEEDPYGFGLVNLSSVRYAKALPVENECGMTIQADRFSMKTEEYPLQKRVSVYSARDLSSFGESFLEFLDTPVTDDIVSKAGLISLAVLTEDQKQKLDRLDRAVKFMDSETPRDLLQSLVLDMLETERLSTVFRFSSNSAELDNKARRDIRRILAYIEEHKPKRIVIAGFTDADGGFEVNRKLAGQRAGTVRDAMISLAQEGAFNDTQVLVRGYGELVPIACNTTYKGRSMNRRVEIWSEN